MDVQKRQNLSCKLGKYNEHMATKLVEKNMTQQAMQHILVPTLISKTKKIRSKAIDHRNCDPLTVGFLHTAFNIKHFNFSKKWTWLMQKYRITPKQSIYTCSCQSGDWGKKQKACFSKWRKGSCTLTPWCKAVDPGTGDWEDVFILSEKRWDQRISSTGIISWWGATTVCGPVAAVLRSHLVVLLGKTTTKKFRTNIFFCYILHLIIFTFNNLPCIQNRRNPGLLCHLWIRLWNQVEHPGVARKNLCSAGALGLHVAPWSLGHGNPLFLDCVSAGCRMSQNSFVSLLPRSASAPWHTQRTIKIHHFG